MAEVPPGERQARVQGLRMLGLTGIKNPALSGVFRFYADGIPEGVVGIQMPYAGK